MEKKRCTAIVLAAGQGKRMGTKIQKQFLDLCGKPVLWYALHAFEKSAIIDDVILVTGKELVEYCRQNIVEKYGFVKVRAVVTGGAERYHSVWNGLRTLEDLHDHIVFIHDGARPFVDEAMIERAYQETVKSGACVVGMPVKDTIKIADENGYIASTPRRSLVWQIQTPQVFDAELIVPAYQQIIEREQELVANGVQITDDAMVVETMCAHPVKLVQGSYENMKLTTPEDLNVAETFLKCQKTL